MNLRAMLLCGALSAATLPAADTLTEEFQRALFEEEANRNLPAAIAGYEAVIKRLDEQRKLAATAVFRMGESYRKLGKTNEAVAAYERIIREFADQETLVKLSGQNLSILRPAPPAGATDRDAFQRRLRELVGKEQEDLNSPMSSGGLRYASNPAAERQALQVFLDSIKEMSPGSRVELAAIAAYYPDARLASLVAEVDKFNNQLVELRAQFGEEHERVRTAVSNYRRLDESILEQRNAIVAAAEARLAALDKLLAGENWTSGRTPSTSLIDPATRARQKELLEQEIALVQDQLKEVRKKVDAGLVPVSEPIGKERELLNLRRKLAALDESIEAIKHQRELIDQELALVRQLIESTKVKVDNGLVSRNDLVELEWQMLQLMREQLDLGGRAKVADRSE